MADTLNSITRAHSTQQELDFRTVAVATLLYDPAAKCFAVSCSGVSKDYLGGLVVTQSSLESEKFDQHCRISLKGFTCEEEQQWQGGIRSIKFSSLGDTESLDDASRARPTVIYFTSRDGALKTSRGDFFNLQSPQGDTLGSLCYILPYCIKAENNDYQGVPVKLEPGISDDPELALIKSEFDEAFWR